MLGRIFRTGEHSAWGREITMMALLLRSAMEEDLEFSSTHIEALYESIERLEQRVAALEAASLKEGRNDDNSD